MSRDAPSLSSNWKKLQQTIKAQPASDQKPPHGGRKPLKRKAEKEAAHAPGENFKKARQDSTLAKKMGGYVSTYIDPSVKPANTQKPAVNPPVAESTTETDAKDGGRARAGKYIAVDCEMVGTLTETPNAVKTRKDAPDFSILARVSIVTYSQDVLYDTYVLPPYDVPVSDYRTPHSGITAWHLNPRNPKTNPKPFDQVQQEVSELFQGRILVGHALNNDLAVLGLSHPKRNIRDTARYQPFRELAATRRTDGTVGKGRTPALKLLAERLLGWEIQSDDRKGHSSVEDAKATMALFQREKAGFEREAIRLFGRSAQAPGSQRPAIATSNGAAVEESDGESEVDAMSELEDEEVEDDDGDGSDDEEEDKEQRDMQRVLAEATGSSSKSANKKKNKKKKKKKKGQYHR